MAAVYPARAPPTPVQPLPGRVRVQGEASRVETAERFSWEPSAFHHALEQLQLGEPGFFLLRLVQAAVCAGASRIIIRVQQTRVRVKFTTPEPLALRSWESRAHHLQDPPQAMDHLVVACLAALADHQLGVTVLSRTPDGDERLRLKGRSGRLERLESTLNGACRLEIEAERARGAFLQELLQGLRRGAAIKRLLRERCGVAPVTIELDGHRLALHPYQRPPRISERERSGGFRSLVQRVVLDGGLALPSPCVRAPSLVSVGDELLVTASIGAPLEGNQTLLYQLRWKDQPPVGLSTVERQLRSGPLAYVQSGGAHQNHELLLREYVRLDEHNQPARYGSFLEQRPPGFSQRGPDPGLAAYAELDLGWGLQGPARVYLLVDGVLSGPVSWDLGVPGAVALVAHPGLSYDPLSLEPLDSQAWQPLQHWLRGQFEEMVQALEQVLEDAARLSRLRITEGWARALVGRLPGPQPTAAPSLPVPQARAVESPGDSPELDHHLGILLGQGRVESSGVFTLAVKQAHLKLGKFQHLNPAYYLLKAVQGAVATGSRQVQVKLGRRDVRVECWPELDHEVLRTLPDRLVGLRMGQKDALDHLVMACSAAQSQSPSVLGWRYAGPRGGFSVKIEGDSFETRVLPPEPGAARLTLYLKRKAGLLDQLAQLASEHASLGERFSFCPVPIFLDGNLLNGENWPGREHLTLHRHDSSPEVLNRAVRLVLAPGGPGTLVPPCMRRLASRFYDLGLQRIEPIDDLVEVSPTLVTQLRWPGPDSPWGAPESPQPLSLQTVPAVSGWRALIYYLAQDHHFPLLRSGVLLRDFYQAGLIKRQRMLLLQGPPSPILRGGPPCHAMLALSDLREPARVWFLQNGMVLDCQQVDLGVPGLLAWVGEVGLATDLSQMHVIENEAYQRALDWLRAEALRMVVEAHALGIPPR